MNMCPYCGKENYTPSLDGAKYGGCCQECAETINSWIRVKTSHGLCENCEKRGGSAIENDNGVYIKCKHCGKLSLLFERDPESFLFKGMKYKQRETITIPERKQHETPPVRCPKCHSTQITTGQRGYSLAWGFIGANKTTNRCANCGYSWQPKK